MHFLTILLFRVFIELVARLDVGPRHAKTNAKAFTFACIILLCSELLFFSNAAFVGQKWPFSGLHDKKMLLDELLSCCWNQTCKIHVMIAQLSNNPDQTVFYVPHYWLKMEQFVYNGNNFHYPSWYVYSKAFHNIHTMPVLEKFKLSQTFSGIWHCPQISWLEIPLSCHGYE